MVEEKVKEIIAEQLGLDLSEINMDSALIDDFGADSLDVVELVMAFESEFDLEIPDDDIEGIAVVSDIVNYIKENTDN